MEASLKQFRIVHAALLASLGMYAWMGEWIKKEPKALDPTVLKMMALLAFAAAAGVLFIRLRLVTATGEKLQSESTDVIALQRWRFLHILSFVLCESIGLYGFVVRMMGAKTAQAAGFYAGAILLMLLSTPRRP